MPVTTVDIRDPLTPETRRWGTSFDLAIPDLAMLEEAIRVARTTRIDGRFATVTAPRREPTRLTGDSPERVYIFVLNEGAEPIRLQFGSDAGETEGIPIKAGGYYENPPHVVCTGMVSVFCSTGDAVITFMEG
jgi:hypothetical protein